MNVALFFALVAVYLVGVAGVVASEWMLPGRDDDLGCLDERLAAVRAVGSPIRGARNRTS